MNQDELNQVESSQRQHFECLLHDVKMSTEMDKAEYNLFAILKPKIYKDGNAWCVLLGDNIQEGICGFGETPYKAILEFNKAFNEAA